MQRQDDIEDTDLSLDATLSVSGLTAPRARTPVPLLERVGEYRVIRKLGEGAMGVVFEAEQPSPSRHVALKVMRQGHLVDDIHLRLFHLEAETLARLRHPGIAAIYESGHTPDGHDFFAMELVRGVTLDQWIKARQLPLTRSELELRLSLFRAICEPVHYAHQRGVIHRDLKPSNIMVVDSPETSTTTSLSGSPSLKILDFGLARITDQDMQAATMMGDVGAIKGTLPYMSPEQAKGDSDKVDLRTDIYGLGVVLYELLTGRRPYDLKSVSLVEALRRIAEEKPRPFRLNWPGPGRPDPDLETIVGKALAREPEDRYSSAAALAEDVERFLQCRPIVARPPSPSYRARKFVARHRLGVASAAAVFLALLLGITVASVGLLRTKRAEAQAHREAETSERVSRFLTTMLGSVDAHEVGRQLLSDLESQAAEAAQKTSQEPTAGDDAVSRLRDALQGVSATDAGRRLVDVAILAKAGAAIDRMFVDEPGVAGRLEHTLGETYEQLGLYTEALEHANQALAIRSETKGERSRETLQTQALVGRLLYRAGQFQTAEHFLSDARSLQASTLGQNHPDTLDSAVKLSWVYIEQGRQDEAEELLRKVLERQKEVLGLKHRDTLSTLNGLAVVYTDQGRYEEAEEIHLRLLDLRTQLLGEADTDTVKTLTNLGVVSFYLGRLDDSSGYFRRVLEIQREQLGPEHPVTLGSANNLAIILERQGRYAEAEALHRDALEAKARTLGPEHPETLSSHYNLAIVHAARGHYQVAEAVHQTVLSSRQKHLGPSHPDTLDSLCAIAGINALQGNRIEALSWLTRAVEHGFHRPDVLEEDADFAALRDDPAFQEILSYARQNATASPTS